MLLKYIEAQMVMVNGVVQLLIIASGNYIRHVREFILQTTIYIELNQK